MPLSDPGGVLLLAHAASLRLERRGVAGDTCAALADWTLGAAAVSLER